MQHAAHIWQSYAHHVPPAPQPNPKDDLLAFPKTSLRYLGLPEDAVPPSREALDQQVSRCIAAVPEGTGATARVEEIRRNATIVRAYVFATLDKRSGGWSASSLEEDETNYTTLEAKKEELERMLASAGQPPHDADKMKRKLSEITQRRDETKARYIASLSQEIMKVARAALGRISPDTIASSEGVRPSSVASMPSPSTSAVDATAPTAPIAPHPTATRMRSCASFASVESFDTACDSNHDATHGTDPTSGDAGHGFGGAHDDSGGIDALDLASALELGDLLSDAELQNMDLDPETPTGPGSDILGSVAHGVATAHAGKTALPPLPPIDLSMLSPQKAVPPPPSRPMAMSWCSWPSQ